MRTHKCALSALTLTAAMAFGATAMAADLPKEGTFNGITAAAGTYKATVVGKDRILVVYDENGLSVGNGVGDHMTYHCFGLADITNGMEEGHGYCVLTDRDGDQVVENTASDGKHPTSAKTFSATGTITTGSGKYVGISGDVKAVLHGPDFKTAAEGTYVQYGEVQTKYKLP